MGWSFDAPDWSLVEGAYYAGMGSELLWVVLSIVVCVAALFVGCKHELDAYKREQEKAGK